MINLLKFNRIPEAAGAFPLKDLRFPMLGRPSSIYRMADFYRMAEKKCGFLGFEET
jgi:hypothetical protein